MQTNTPPRAEFLPISKLRPFENHPFRVKDDAEMDQLVFSVLTQGLLTPIVVREIDTEEFLESRSVDGLGFSLLWMRYPKSPLPLLHLL